MKAILLLEDGTIFHGKAAGFSGDFIGELVFNTAFTGYEEILSDPSYLGQIVLFTSSHIGNTGITMDDLESNQMFAEALICKEFSSIADNYRSKQSMEEFLIDQKKLIFYDIDTRYLTQLIRDKGCQNAILSSVDFETDSLTKKLKSHKALSERNAIAEYAERQQYQVINKGGKWKVAVYDFGIKGGILDQLTHANCEAHVFSHNSKAEDILKIKPDGLFLSNGPGNPEVMQETVNEIKELINQLPTFGICMGHQLLGLALGGKTFKMKFGHHAANHPVSFIHAKEQNIQSVEITSQNHNYAVDMSGVENVEITHQHLNDKTVSGLKLTDKPVFSVQYHPESNPGPHDSHYLFKQFIDLMADRKAVANA